MNQTLVSVVMPVYNAAAWLDASVGSVLAQTFGNWELVCFNDASTDSSSAILHRYAAAERRIRVIDSAVNVKQGGGRNRAVAAARGRYIVFLDADDRLAPDALELCAAAVERMGADAVFFDYATFTAAGTAAAVSPLGADASSLPVAELRRRLTRRPTPVWTAMYERRLIERLGLQFPEGVFYEDNAVALAIQLSARRPVKLDGALYLYRTDNLSVSRSTGDMRFFDRIGSARTLLGHLRRLGLYDEFAAEIDFLITNQYLVHTVYGAIYRFDSVQTDRIAEVRSGIDSLVPGWRRNPFWRGRPLRERIKFSTHLHMPRLIKTLSRLKQALNRHRP